MVNYFELMNLPVNFDIDTNQLDTTFRQLQSQYHPDTQTNVASNTQTFLPSIPVLANLNAEQSSAVINQAYQTLKFADSRATHLLELVGQGEHLQDSIRDLEFLDKAMDLRIALDEASVAQLPPLSEQLMAWLAEVSNQFSIAYMAQNWQAATLSTQKLKFLVKLQKDLAKKTDELAEKSQNNDDDLYV